MTSTKLQHWLQQGRLPQRLLLSGSGDLLSLALDTAAQLLQSDPQCVKNGLDPDVKIAADDGQSLKIGEVGQPDALTVRGLIQWLNQTPVAAHRVLVLQNLERTSRDAMQAWLKVLEEPPRRAQFILTTQNHHRLPTTILSRVTVLPISGSFEAEGHEEAAAFLQSENLIEQFKRIEAIDKAHKENPQATSQFIIDVIKLARQEPALHQSLPLLWQAQQDLSRNVNRRLVLEHLALELQNR